MTELDVAVGSAAARLESADAVAERFDVRYGRDALLRRILASADLATVAAAAFVLYLAGRGLHVALLLVLSAPAWIVTAKVIGLYDRDHRTVRHLTVDELPRIAVWAFASTAFRTLVTAPFPSLAIDGNDRLIIWTSAIGIGFLLRATGRAVWRRVTPPERLLIVGEGPLADALVRKLDLFPDIHAEIGARFATFGELRGHLDRLDGVDRIIVASSELNEELLEEILPVCRLRGVKLTVVPPTRGMFGTATHLGHIAELPLLDYNTWDISRFTLVLKRGFDVVLATLGLIVSAPLFFLAALAILLDDGRPVVFRQTRAGEDGRPFRIVKFRTMVKNAESLLPGLVSFDELHEPVFKLRGDPRVTRAGRLLRRWSLDELPQLFNVLRGQMSIVGPRPEQLELVERYLPEHEFRLKVKPGITGPMQVYGRGELLFSERLAVEREYIENLSLGRDLRIVLMTLPAVLRRHGAY